MKRTVLKTVLKVTNLNPDFTHVDGFWLTTQSDGGLDRGDDGEEGTADDKTIAPAGTLGSDKRGTWIWINGTNTTLDGDPKDKRSQAGMIYLELDKRGFYWNPKNPDYNQIVEILPNGDENQDFDNSNNPIALDARGRVRKIGEACKHFDIGVVPADSDEEIDEEIDEEMIV